MTLYTEHRKTAQNTEITTEHSLIVMKCLFVERIICHGLRSLRSPKSTLHHFYVKRNLKEQVYNVNPHTEVRSMKRHMKRDVEFLQEELVWVNCSHLNHNMSATKYSTCYNKLILLFYRSSSEQHHVMQLHYCILPADTLCYTSSIL
jgi:hypothetical protein